MYHWGNGLQYYMYIKWEGWRRNKISNAPRIPGGFTKAQFTQGDPLDRQ